MSCKCTRILWALVLLGLLAALFILGDRFQREQANGRVEMVLDLGSAVSLARAEGLPVDQVLERFQAWGVRSVAVTEQTVDDLAMNGQARACSGMELAELQRQGRVQAGPEPLPDRLYLVARSSAVAARLQHDAEAALGQGRARLWPATGAAVIELIGDPKALAQAGLGIPEGVVEHLSRDLGFQVWLRPENTPGASPQALESRLRALAAMPGVQGVVFSGVRNEALGYPDQLELVARLLGELNLKLGLIELPDKVQQKGTETLARLATAQVVRVMAVPPAQQARSHPEVVAGMFSLGARERNIRVLYLRPYSDIVEDLTVDQANDLLFGTLRADLAAMLDGHATTFPEARGGWLVPWTLVAAGTGAAFALLLSQVVPVTASAAATIVFLLALGTWLTGFTGLAEHPWRAVMALGVATVFPTLGLVLQFPLLDRARRQARPTPVLWLSTRALLAASAFSLAGGLMAASFLPETTYMLSVDLFRGVKVHGLLVPLLVLSVWAVQQHGPESVVRLLEARLRVWHLVVLVVLGALGAFYLARTGNVTGDLAVSDSERLLRRWLDVVLGVRPRFKEFVLGNPALVLAPLLARWRWPGLLPFALLAAAVGQASLSDTYAHIHTPLLVSLVRTGWGVLVGWGLGVVLALVLFVLEGRLVQRWPGLRPALDREPGQQVEQD